MKWGKIFNSSIPDDFEEGLQNWHLEMISKNMHLRHYSSQGLILVLLSNLVCGLAFIANSTETLEKMESQKKNCLAQIALWAYGEDIVLIAI